MKSEARNTKLTKYFRNVFDYARTIVRRGSLQIFFERSARWRRVEKFPLGRGVTGFTLFEFLIYLGIVSVVLTMAGAVGLNIMLRKVKLTAVKEVSQNARLASEKISAAVRNAEAVLNPNPGSTASVLSLQMADVAENPTVFDLSGGALRIKKGPDAAVELTSGQISITNLVFSNISYPITPGTVRTRMDVEFVNPSGRPEYDWAQSFFTTANVRKK